MTKRDTWLAHGFIVGTVIILARSATLANVVATLALGGVATMAALGFVLMFGGAL